MAVSDGKLIAAYQTHCARCEHPALGLGRTKKAAAEQLIHLGWKKVDGLWVCCGPEAR